MFVFVNVLLGLIVIKIVVYVGYSVGGWFGFLIVLIVIVVLLVFVLIVLLCII